MIHEHKTNKLIKLHIYGVSGLFWTLAALEEGLNSGRPAEYSLSCRSAIGLSVKKRTEADKFEKDLGLLKRCCSRYPL